MSNDTLQFPPVIGIGASAGGLEALREVVSRISSDSRACHVVIQHFAADQKSIMDQLLQSETDLPVSQIAEGDRLAPGHVFVVPPGQSVEIDGDRFVLRPRRETESLYLPIDIFFTSLAEARGRDAYAVILSGTGSDGADGVRAVKARGGVAIVQDSASARFAGMPDSAVATGLVDFVLPAGRIAERLEEIIAHRAGLSDGSLVERLHDAIQENLPRITDRLAKVSGNDFSSYKSGTLIRRIERRMALLRTTRIDDFLELLEASDEQAEILAQEFLIGVTQFFRDPASFEALREEVIKPAVARDQRSLRVWVPGCATGEEAYTIAMICQEEMERAGRRFTLQIFGTDIDLPALVSARYGLYSPAAVEALPEGYRDRFFGIENGQYRVIPTLRECCVFAPHNLVQDPPFSRLDLITCRNLMIYLSADIQKRIIPRLHFSLRDQGCLFLGPSEGLAGEDDLFLTVDKTHRIFRRNPEAETRYSALHDPVPRSRVASGSLLKRMQASQPGPVQDYSRETSAEREFLRRHAAPFALISGDGEVTYLSERMVRYVQPSHGTPSNIIDAYLARELRVPVRNALSEARETRAEARIDDILVADGEVTRFVDVRVSPTSMDRNLFLLSLTEVRSVDPDSLGTAIQDRETSDRDMLEIENFSLRRQLAAALEEHETSGQELKSSNEELLSMNEELQSSNEELETSREELQSINEELETVNSELQENNRQLIRAHSDLKNLFESTDVAVLFLDRAFCVRNFTPATTALFGIRQRDVGRPIFDLYSRVDYPQLRDDAARVDETLQPIDREVSVLATDETYLLRIKPYRTTENVIDGYVMSFVDISNRKRFEEQLKRNERALARQYAELENLYDTTPVGLALVDRSFKWLRINDHLAEINGFSAAAHEGKTFDDLIPKLAEEIKPVYQSVFDTGEAVRDYELSGQTPAGGDKIRHWLCDFYPVASDGRIFAVGSCVREVTEQKRLVERIQDQNERQTILLGELQHRVKNTLATIQSISKLLLRTSDTPQDYQKRLSARLAALGQTHDLLTEANWTSISLSSVIERELAPYGTSRTAYTFDGPKTELSTRQTVAVGMAIHELATNAAKYGALSSDGGHVEITVEIDGIQKRIEWKEHGGPPIDVAPDRRGFGSIMLETIVARDLDGTITLTYEPDGLRCLLVFPEEAA